MKPSRYRPIDVKFRDVFVSLRAYMKDFGNEKRVLSLAKRLYDNVAISEEETHWQQSTATFIKSMSKNFELPYCDIVTPVRGVGARSPRILMISLKYYCNHSLDVTAHSKIMMNYPSHYSLISSNITKYSTRASRSNTGTCETRRREQQQQHMTLPKKRAREVYKI